MEFNNFSVGSIILLIFIGFSIIWQIFFLGGVGVLYILLIFIVLLYNFVDFYWFGIILLIFIFL